MRRVLRWLGVALLGLLVLLGGLHVMLGRGEALSDAPPPDTLRIATWNVHYIDARRDEGRWARAGWARRAPAVDAVFKAMDADLIAFQEMESFRGGNADDDNLARRFLLAQNPGHAAAAVGDWREFPSTQPIFYRRDRLELLDKGWFFFSETPDVLYARTFNGSYPAFTSWAQFRDRRGGAVFRVVNLHTDFASRLNRRRSLELLSARTRPWLAAGETVILAGDFNAIAGSPLLRALERAGFRFIDVPGATYHFDRGLHLLPAIDHLALSGTAKATGPAVVIRARPGGVWPADHYPVVADIRLDR
jgi:endonuclease/exonuclease/phosphatase family metal-dependent hydrolase